MLNVLHDPAMVVVVLLVVMVTAVATCDGSGCCGVVVTLVTVLATSALVNDFCCRCSGFDGRMVLVVRLCVDWR